MELLKSKVIYGCDSRGDGDSAYLTRWTLLETRWGNLYLHQFHRSDSVDLHCHPWNFWSVVLWPGYYEVTPRGSQRRWPLIPAFRPATWRHRVELLARDCSGCRKQRLRGWNVLDCPKCAGAHRVERSCWTLIWAFPKVRDWGFFTPTGWQDWRDYFREKGC